MWLRKFIKAVVILHFDGRQFKSLLSGVALTIEHRNIAPSNIDISTDIGANKGQFSLLAEAFKSSCYHFCI